MGALALLLAALLALQAAPAAAQPEQVVPAYVARVTDGDTITVRLESGRLETVRLIGIDTPETRHPALPVQCFGREASARTRELALDKPTELELDVQQRDRYRRLLAYVWIDGEMLNWGLAAEGYAMALTIPPNVRYADYFRSAAAAAREQGLGLWGRVSASTRYGAS